MALQKWSFLCGFLAGISAISIYTILKWKKDNKEKEKKIESVEVKDDCIFFSPSMISASCFKNPKAPCHVLSCPKCNYQKFFSLIDSVEKSLDICVYLITVDEITKAIVNKFKEGVFVRIIVDKDMSDEAYNSKVFVFIKEHIPIKVIGTGEMMHNKFVIIDQKILITGSFNWTKTGIWSNYENGLIIYNVNIIEKYKTFFQSIWLTP